MTIISSALIDDSPQIDGRRQIGERHVDDLGQEHLFHYLGAANTNAGGVMANRVPLINADLTASEIANNLVQFTTMGAAAHMSISQSTIAQNLSAVALILPTLDAAGIVSMIAFLNQLGGPTLQLLFGFTPAQVTSMQSTAATLPTQVATALTLLKAVIKGGS